MPTAPQRETVFLAGASGAVGRRLCALLAAEGWCVVGMTRSREKTDRLAALGVIPVVLDVFDRLALEAAVRRSGARIVMHQLTDLPHRLDPAAMPAARERNARLRQIGTRNLVDAARACGVTRFIAQSIAFAYADGSKPHAESAPLVVDAPDAATALNARGVESLERQVLGGPFIGIVLRYGRLYGPGTGFASPGGAGPVHVDAAAQAARLALTRGTAGVYNIVEDDGVVSNAKAMRSLGWRPSFRF